MKTDPVTALCNAVMHAFARLADAPPVRAARATLGDPKFYDVACEAMRKHVKAALTPERAAEVLKDIQAVGAQWACSALVLEIATAARDDVVAAGAVAS